MNTPNLLSALTLTLLFPVSALTDEISSEKEKLFENFDQNKDNVISVDEADKNALLFSQFSKIDKNHDKQLERSEFSAYEPEETFEPPLLEDPGIGAAPLD